MSGPVWKLLKLAGPCDACGETAEELLSVGTVVDFEFRPEYRYCRGCYERYKGHRDELHPKAVAEQRAPGVISRPTTVSDLPE